MENESLVPLQKPYGTRKPRGKKLPPAIRNQIKPVEGKSSLRSIAKAYGVNHQHLSATAYGDRKAPHLIQILEMEFKLPIEEIRAIFQKARESRQGFKEQQAENGMKISQSQEAKAILKNMGKGAIG
ncbi:hypothetical protein LEP1GSC013_3513 [Leptospira interrogans serovar Valbuzzi str. Duyster]|uniref:hypothetical protein n=1 Tax=Leptospira interrogans TaxID=173 RepID=UPI0002B97029|nr:hypothetical protein [Leptospira interrogans]EMJ52034.1 hypothetical protein LEP1GSC013_1014 [Leptospira interrogans serovar Valbuzzi str. Duyster]EMJ53693.1 hypothetical protein LEP1GSC013_1753 [Leptospira interrogans serovar Valbuzzi str. Duyster]EMJ54784.1 hypothetical protein LEP1GSC013_2551 [Leptospira interrogans serovar Valbuzzi str. Duyster]EMJ54832.1 hypothetical protein LEP1GSC013_2484 [Leptospira interrogans serovar Valbuzzi str. Duyster]EMJ55414.1 hypothetical protein LEP1GSC013